MSELMTDEVLKQLRTAGLMRPRPPYPGQPWQPRTPAEEHLLREGCRLDRVRQLLLGEVGKLRHEVDARAGRRQRLAVASRTAVRLSGCPLTPSELKVIAAAAAGESAEDTSLRLVVAYDTVRTQRKRAVHRLGARSMTHAVALAVEAGWISSEQIRGGLTP
ncbi:LuxR C-terminal-related transcriptional regulator [Streptomyces sp. NBC_00827]|uniref:LuxR C-terminal-related transcriptional regulator n=1 Tax=Streptomyces sp. NBC_00827 TaxID=2903677 RepID=UPI00386D5C2A|nr:LuxR C-terminal-related transcriptional regulator [Streptomyces sp. NBC_00827]